ncbi:MAG: hypothetical protein KF893_25585 [Caldilineaceae bacterium]|nr:hypothetical protein [Caldilineaceae bacterium]
MTHANGTGAIINGLAETKSSILATVLQAGRRRAENVSRELTRYGAAAAYAEKLNSAVFELIHRLYEPDTDGVLCNVDPVSGRFNIDATWGSVGRPKYGLRRTEGDTLRRYVQWLSVQKHPRRLFWHAGQRWYVDLAEYPDLDDALLYWRLVEMTAAHWRRFTTQAAS